MPWNPARWQYLPGRTRREVATLARAGQVEDARDLLERAWAHAGDDYPWSFHALLNLIQATQGTAAAESRARAELDRRLSSRAEGLVAARLAWLYLDIAQVGAWRWRAPGWRESEAVRLAELGHRRAPEVPMTAAALAVVRAYQGSLSDSRRLARQFIKRVRSDTDPYFVAAMHVALGLAAAGEGDVDAARHELVQAQQIAPQCDVIAALETSLPVALAGGIEAYWNARPDSI